MTPHSSADPFNPPAVRSVAVGDVVFGGPPASPPPLIAGPCVIESPEHVLEIARRLAAICRDAGAPLVFKASWDKANRTSAGAFRGPGLEAGLEALEAVRRETGLPVLTDVHREEDVERVAEAVDCVQIPAFLCRQTDLLVAAARTGRPVNVKKGQFLAPEDMARVVEKIASAGNEQVLVTERGSSFGYHNLVVDMRGLVIMRRIGVPVVFDATHSVQLPGGAGTASGGDRDFAPPLVRAAVAVGVDGVFVETHPAPEEALCDGPNSMALDRMPALLEQMRRVTSALWGGGAA